jgi:hypothetical protein
MDWVVTFPWIEWPPSRGLGGHHAVDWVVTIAWIGWSLSVEYTDTSAQTFFCTRQRSTISFTPAKHILGRFAPKYVWPD